MFPFNDPSHHDYQSHLQNLFSSQLISLPEGSSSDNYLNTDRIQITTQNEERKIMHRDLERERRKQMASLLTNLRSLLPLEFIKGKRTRADIVDEAVNYIEHLRGKISELQVKRYAILKRLNFESSSCDNQCCNNLSSPSCVVIKPYSGGLEIVISNCIMEENFQLSGVMRVLFEQSIQIESCAATKVKERMLHTIQTKVDDSSRIDLHELQQKLYQVCNSE
ncbi:transcription factor bHLH118-like [Benincasa hispida]|uniref:transcription factor bHLH118-like n=1 Tax=Benincasa hispida TaxID=102211 RepID=UPI0018FF2CAC|nr:transcription factor bHLH118-like [Benincasa hispida]